MCSEYKQHTNEREIKTVVQKVNRCEETLECNSTTKNNLKVSQQGTQSSLKSSSDNDNDDDVDNCADTFQTVNDLLISLTLAAIRSSSIILAVLTKLTSSVCPSVTGCSQTALRKISYSVTL